MTEHEHRASELATLNAVARAAWGLADGEPPLTTATGATVRDPETGEPLRDPTPALDGIDVLLHVMERRAALLDLDAEA